MNELLFFSHLLLVIGFILVALKLGKDWLIGCFTLQIILANLLVFKQISFFGFTMTCTEMLSIGSIFSLNLIQEFYGKECAKRAIWISFFTLLFFVAMTQFHLLYRPSLHDTTQASYKQILGFGPRVIFASLTVSFLVQRLDMRIYDFIKRRIAPSHLVLRSTYSLIFTQFLDTILFSYVGLFGLVHNIFHVMVASYIIKLFIIFTMAPFTALTKRLIKPRYETI